MKYKGEFLMLNIELPRICDNDSDYYKSLEDAFNEYEEFINSNYPEKYKEIKNYCEKILKAINSYNSAAFETSQKVMKNILMKLIEMYPDLVSNPFEIYKGVQNYKRNSSLGEEYYFKARVLPTDYKTKTTDMYHIPFNRRDLVATQRFSLPGIPCLYLGKTSFVCWQELGKPAANSFYVAAVKPVEKLKLLNLAYTNAPLINSIACDIEKEENINIKKDLQSVLNCSLGIFPFIIATSFKIYGDDRNFKSEYIVSQLIMMLLFNRKWDGIAYSSKRMPMNERTFATSLNIAIMPKRNDKEAYSPLMTELVFKRPVNFEEFKLISCDDLWDCPQQQSTSYSKMELANKPRKYANSTFSIFDGYLVNQEDL